MIESEIFKKLRKDVFDSIDYLLKKIDPEKRVQEFLIKEGNKLKIGEDEIDLNKFDKIFLISFGKAGVKMAKGALSKINFNKGLVISNIDYFDFPNNIEYIKGEHPTPGNGSFYAGKKLIELSNEIKENDLTIILISGGGSSLVEYPLIPLSDLKELTSLMLKHGLSIDEINTIRKHISKIKGGKLLKYLKGKVYSLIISDVIGDDLSVISSGVTYFDNSTFLDALNNLKNYDLIDRVPKSVIEIINKGIKGEISETLKENEFPKKRVKNFIISSNYDACKILINFFKDKGYNTFYLGSRINGDVKDVSKVIGGIIIDIYENKIDVPKPCVLLYGGETTVIVKGNGIGGRNQEIALLISKYIQNKNILFLSFGTDGIDGNSPASGAIVDGETLNRAKRLNLDYKKFLENNDTYNFFKQLNDLIILGPTGNNVMDIGIAIII